MAECRAYYEHLINEKAEQNKKAKMTEEEKKIAEYNEAFNEAAKLSERVKDILYLANKCKANGIKIPEKKNHPGDYNAAKPYGYDAEFIADGWRHHVGLAEEYGNNGKYKYLMIRNGGACGNIDLKVTEDDIWGVYDGCDMKGQRTQPRTCDLKKFAKEFPEFEAAFYKWLESLKEEEK